jgi:decaprenyl-phosphate phosphoribosyltransferase
VLSQSTSSGPAFWPYVQIARFDHWFKNVFVLPGTVVAVYAQPGLLEFQALWHLLIALLATGFVASSNYVINEVLDAPFDALHPVKRNRPIPSGRVNIKWAYVEWIGLALVGLAVAATLGLHFFLVALALWIMGCVYNIPPVRSKDQPYLDVLSESVNNPLRLLLGWYATGIEAVPPISLVCAYWMVGAFFMAVKRFGEYRRIDDPQVAREYRRSFAHYNEERLLVSITYYGTAFGLFFGIFLLRYKMELILSIPVIAGFIAWYIHLGFKEDSPTQYPEHLYKQKGFFGYTIACAVVLLGLLLVDIPAISQIFAPTIRLQ